MIDCSCDAAINDIACEHAIEAESNWRRQNRYPSYAQEQLAYLAETDKAYEGSRHPGSARFHEIISQLGALHDRKQRDYGAVGDPFRNVRNSEDFGIPAWVGAVLRANDKMRRLQTAAQQVLAGEDVNMSNESIIDSFQDLAVYAIIAEVLYEEENNGD